MYNSQITKDLLLEQYKSISKQDHKVVVNFNQNFTGSPYLQVTGNSTEEFLVKFFDEDKLYHETKLKPGMFTKLNRAYYTNWKTEIYNSNNELVYNNTLDLTDKKVLIAIDSKSLGDNLAWMPYLEEFRIKHNCKVVAHTYLNDVFKSQYPEIEFVENNTRIQGVYATYYIGYFYDENKEPTLPQIKPLQQQASDILGLEFKEIRPLLSYTPIKNTREKKYITIGPHSTAQLKYWNNNDWQILIDYLVSNGYDVINVAREGCKLNNVINLEDYSLNNIMNTILYSEFFIGLGSGLSWLAWSMHKDIVLIANFSEADHEMQDKVIRITNPNVCHGCWNNPNFKFDRNDFNWCPIMKGTKKEFECHKSINAQMVIDKITHLIK